MKNYIMESSEEASRLEKQSENNQFDLSKELSGIDFSQYKTLLDAGCGTGLLGRYVLKSNPNIEYYGCDQSEERIKFAKSNCPDHFNFFAADLYNENFTDKKFDVITSRYVMHHLDDRLSVLKNLKSKLNKNGKIVIIDADGIMVNIGSNNEFVLSCLKKFDENFTGWLSGARYLPGLLKQAGFENVKYKIEVMDFQGADRVAEIEQLAQRLEFGKETYIEIFGSELEFVRFKKEYLAEIEKSFTPFYCNRFVIEAY